MQVDSGYELGFRGVWRARSQLGGVMVVAGSIAGHMFLFVQIWRCIGF